MARRRYRRYRRSRGRWSSNLTRLRLTGDALADQPFGDTYTIAQNPAQSNTSVSQQYTVKNIEISGQLEAENSGSENLEEVAYYIMFVPEGYPIDLNLPYSHPEWIMAYKYIGQSSSNIYPNNSSAQPPRIKTRLSRRLNTGDSIIFLFTGFNGNQTLSIPVKFTGLVRWWTKAN